MNRKGDGIDEMLKNIKRLRQWLPNGYVSIIANELGVNPMTVSNALQGKSRRFDIIKKAVDLAKEQKAIADELKQLVNELED